MTPLVEFARANPLVLLPVVAVGSLLIYAALKKLLKLATIVSIAAALWVVLIRYLGV